ncbi:MAG: GTP diphosphokinase [Succinivibrio sp.]|nr:GTP diphosphokinase [Succinivibrio sp.]
MVAIRTTHEASFDFKNWIEELKLPQSERLELHKTCDFVMQCLDQKEKKLKNADVAADRERFVKLSAEIVSVLMTVNMDLMSLKVSIVYPAFEEGYISSQEVLDHFGAEAHKLLMNVRDMEAIRFLQTLRSSDVSEAKVDRIRRMMLAMVEDVRAVVIKLAERIAVIRAAKNADEQTRVTIAREVANIYAPLANRLGIGQLKWELEDLAFRCLHPDEYKEIASDLGERRVERERYIENFVNELRELLGHEGLKCEVYGRPKHIYSIWRKMQRKHLRFDELYDIRAVRVIVEKISDCYAVLGIVHTRWKHIQEQFDDYIANPKSNGYQSIHTVVYGDGDKRVEIQIRTRNMHNTAELGVAAHWKYKEGAGQSSGVEQRINWLRKLLAWRDDLVESGTLMEEFKNQIFEDRVYVFTPAGEVIDLPTGATPLDFAYQVHTMVGHRCIGAKVNGRIVPFTYALHTGETVEIITQKNPNPSRDWLNPDSGFLKTSRARAKVQSYFRKVDYGRNRTSGEEAVARELERRGVNLSKDELMSLIEANLERFNVKKSDDLFAGIGAGDISVNTLMAFLSETAEARKSQAERDADLRNLIEAKSASAVEAHKGQKTGSVTVDGVDNLLTHVAHCCQPIPGDEIVGFITKGRGVSIHRASCPMLLKLAKAEPEKVVAAQWGSAEGQSYTITMRITGQDYPGMLRDITTMIANEKLNIAGVRSRVDRDAMTSIIDIDLLVSGLAVFERLRGKIMQIPQVSAVQRI